MEQKWIIITGDLTDGVMGVVGPFDDKDAAHAYGDQFNMGHYEKHVMELEPPDQRFREPAVVVEIHGLIAGLK